jgi:hypothetical protein
LPRANHFSKPAAKACDLDGGACRSWSRSAWLLRHARATGVEGIELDVMHACGHDTHMSAWVGTVPAASRTFSNMISDLTCLRWVIPFSWRADAQIEQGLRLAACGLRLAACGLIFISTSTHALPDAAVTAELGHDDHTATTDVDIYITADGALRADVDCAGCLLDVRVQQWTDAHGFAVQELLGETRITLDTHDAFSFIPSVANDVIAWDVVLLVERERGFSEELKQTFFGRYKDGAFEPLEWFHYAEAGGYARLKEIDKRTVVELLAPAQNVRIQPDTIIRVDEVDREAMRWVGGVK